MAFSCFFYFVVAIFVTSIWRHSHFKSAFCSFVHAISAEVLEWLNFSLLLERVFFLFAWLKFWSHLTYLTHKNAFLTLKLTFIYFNSEKVIWVCVTLNEGFLRAANKGSFCLNFTVFWDCRSTKLLRLFSGNLPDMFRVWFYSQVLPEYYHTVLIANEKLSNSEAKPKCYDNFEGDNNRVVIFLINTCCDHFKIKQFFWFFIFIFSGQLHFKRLVKFLPICSSFSPLVPPHTNTHNTPDAHHTHTHTHTQATHTHHTRAQTRKHSHKRTRISITPVVCLPTPRDDNRDSREVRCVFHTRMVESSIPWLREAVCVRMSS